MLVVCQYYYPEQFIINDICAELVNEGHEVTVLTGLPNYPSGVIDKEYGSLKKRHENIQGVNVIRSWLIGRGKGNLSLILNYLSFAATASLKSLFIRKDFDVIFVYQLSPVTMAIPGILLRALTRKPLILYCLDLWPESIVSRGVRRESLIYSILLRLTRWIYRKADKILISSSQFENYLAETLRVRKKIRYLPSYAEEVFFSTKKVENGIIDFVFAGNIGEMQSVQTIIRAAELISDAKGIWIHIVGGGTALNECKALLAELSLENVTFYGHLPLHDMPRFYELADVFLITLKDNPILSYTLPRKVQTYMVSGKPIIAAINGETAKVIEEARCGLCSPAEDHHALAGNMMKFIKNQAEYAQYGENARKYYNDHFSKEIFMRHLAECIGDANWKKGGFQS
jgi:glycosyltransferase involved in cell wall biosynthesis